MGFFKKDRCDVQSGSMVLLSPSMYLSPSPPTGEEYEKQLTRMKTVAEKMVSWHLGPPFTRHDQTMPVWTTVISCVEVHCWYVPAFCSLKPVPKRKTVHHMLHPFGWLGQKFKWNRPLPARDSHALEQFLALLQLYSWVNLPILFASIALHP